MTCRSLVLILSAIILLQGCQREETTVDVPVVSDTAAPTMPATDTAPPATSVTLTVRQYEGRPYLADASGRALYLLEADQEGQSTCYDQCADVWPPLLSSGGTPVADDPSVHANRLGTIQRRNGAMQITYNNHPLYYYVKDEGPGQTTGQDVHDEWGEWYLVTPAGTPLEEK